MYQERILVTDKELPPVPISIKRYVQVNRAEDSLFLIINTTRWDQFIISKAGVWICTHCGVVVYSKDWGASMQISHPYTANPYFVLEVRDDQRRVAKRWNTRCTLTCVLSIFFQIG